jgi:hypothetical protein
MGQTREFIVAVALWVAAICTLAFGIADSVQARHNSIALAVSVFLAVCACVPTMMAVARYYLAAELEDGSVERIVEIVDALHERGREVSKLH